MLRKRFRFFNMKMTLFFMGCALGAAVLIHYLDTLHLPSRYCASQTKEYSKIPTRSQPSSRCENQTHRITWFDWLIGNSLTNQLHFIDFLELLHGNNRIPLSQVSSINSYQSLNLC